MKRVFYLLLLFGLFCFTARAQQKMLTIEDAVINQYSTLAPERLNQLEWIPGTNSFSYAETKGDGEQLVKGDATSEKRTALVTLAVLNTELKRLEQDTLRRFPQITWKDENSFTFGPYKRVLQYDLKSKKLNVLVTRDLPDEAENFEKSPKGDALAFTVKNNLYIYYNGKTVQITNDEDEGIVNGKSVHREEFGIYKGTFWSPEGNHLAFYRMDERMVEDYPIIDFATKPGKNKNIKYPMAGTKSHEVTIGVYDLGSGKTTFLKTGEPKEQYLTNVAWNPGEEAIYVAVLKRAQNHMKLNRYNAKTGDFEKTLFEEENEKYVEPLHPVEFVTGHADEFIWQSNRDGWNHLYLYNTDGKLVRQLTQGKWVVTDFEGFDPKGNYAFFSSTATSPLNQDLYKVKLSNGKIERLTTGQGTHAAVLNENGKYFIDYYTSTTVPLNTAVLTTDGKVAQKLLESDNPLKDYAIGEMRFFTIKNDTGDDLYCRMFLPPDFDSTRKYPVITYLYGGPHAQMVRNRWIGGANLWFPYMAEKGYIMFTLDNRGSMGRGRDFEQTVFRQLGTLEMQDQLKGVEFLRSKSYVDTTRMGIHGWSFGGFMTISMMTRHPGIYKVAVAGGPVINWRYYEVMYTERYMDTPEENPQGYKANNLLNYVKNLQGDLLIIHGTSDPVVVWQHSLMYLKKAVDENVQLDYFVYPGHEHNVRGIDRVHLMTKITKYFEDRL